MASVSSLSSWNDGAAKSAIVDFVARVTREGSPDFVRAADRIAAFDNDGTLWCEQPMQAQLFFAQDRLRDLAANDPSMKERQPFKAFLERDMQTLSTGAFQVVRTGDRIRLALAADRVQLIDMSAA